MQGAQLEERQQRLAEVAESALAEAASLHAPVSDGASSELRLATGALEAGRLLMPGRCMHVLCGGPLSCSQLGCGRIQERGRRLHA